MPHYFINDKPIENGQIILERRDGQAWTNVPCLVVHHTPDGFEWGYGGSGPADLALNIIEYMLREKNFVGSKAHCFHGEAFNAAILLHQDFKWQCIATVPREKGGFIPTIAIMRWINDKLIETPIAK